MRQLIEGLHKQDAAGMPAGGQTRGVGIDIRWQDGPLGREEEGPRVEPNGAFVEGVIQSALDRLNYYQSSKFNCRENALAITKLEEALHWCDHRTQAREALQVEGTHETH